MSLEEELLSQLQTRETAIAELQHELQVLELQLLTRNQRRVLGHLLSSIAGLVPKKPARLISSGEGWVWVTVMEGLDLCRGRHHQEVYLTLTLGLSTQRTSTHTNVKHPVWGETFCFDVSASRVLEVVVYGGGSGAATCEVIGSATVSLDPAGPPNRWVTVISPLLEVGHVCLGLQWPPDVGHSTSNPAVRDPRVDPAALPHGAGAGPLLPRGPLVDGGSDVWVTVMEGQGLFPPEAPEQVYVALTVGTQREQTSSCKSTPQPVWGETFGFRAQAGQVLMLVVFGCGTGPADPRVIGSASVVLDPNSARRCWASLQGSGPGRGQVCIGLQWPSDVEASDGALGLGREGRAGAAGAAARSSGPAEDAAVAGAEVVGSEGQGVADAAEPGLHNGAGLTGVGTGSAGDGHRRGAEEGLADCGGMTVTTPPPRGPSDPLSDVGGTETTLAVMAGLVEGVRTGPAMATSIQASSGNGEALAVDGEQHSAEAVLGTDRLCAGSGAVETPPSSTGDGPRSPAAASRPSPGQGGGEGEGPVGLPPAAGHDDATRETIAEAGPCVRDGAAGLFCAAAAVCPSLTGRRGFWRGP